MEGEVTSEPMEDHPLSTLGMPHSGATTSENNINNGHHHVDSIGNHQHQQPQEDLMAWMSDFVGQIDSTTERLGWNDHEAASQALVQLDGRAKIYAESLSLVDKASWRLLRERLLIDFPTLETTAHHHHHQLPASQDQNSATLNTIVNEVQDDNKETAPAEEENETKPETEDNEGQPLTILEKIELRRSLKQKKGETAQAFHDRCIAAQEKISEDPRESPGFERDVLINFVLGLQYHLHAVVIRCGAKNLEGFLTSAIDAENIKIPTLKSAMNKKKKGISYKDVTVKVEEDADAAFIDDREVGAGYDEAFHGATDFDYKPSTSSAVKEEVDPDDVVEALQDEDEEGEEGGLDGDYKHNCEICGRGFNAEAYYKYHMNKEHGDIKDSKFKCEHCPAFFAGQRNFKLHMEQAHPELVFPCEVCGFVCYSRLKSMLHLGIKHRPEPSEPGKFKCRFCEKELGKKAYLRLHIHNQHIQEKKFPCNVCEKVFNSNHLLQKHVRGIHLNEKKKQCEHCEKAYMSLAALRYHQRSAHNIGDKFKCEECGKEANSPDALKEHIARYHRKEPSVICEECGKGFYKKEVLKKHVYFVHMNVAKTIPCSYDTDCKKMFRNHHELKKHISVVHTKENLKFSCEYCPQKFGSRLRQADHINGVHLNKKTHQCPYANCSFITAYRGIINKHLRSSHGGRRPQANEMLVK